MVCRKDDTSPTLVQIRLIPISWSSSVLKEKLRCICDNVHMGGCDMAQWVKLEQGMTYDM